MSKKSLQQEYFAAAAKQGVAPKATYSVTQKGGSTVIVIKEVK